MQKRSWQKWCRASFRVGTHCAGFISTAGNTKNLKPKKDPVAILRLLRKSPTEEAVRAALSNRKTWTTSVTQTLKALGLDRPDVVFMVLQVLHLEKRPLDARKFTIGMSACARASLWREAITLLKFMSEAKVQGEQSVGRAGLGRAVPLPIQTCTCTYDYLWRVGRECGIDDKCQLRAQGFCFCANGFSKLVWLRLLEACLVFWLCPNQT